MLCSWFRVSAVSVTRRQHSIGSRSCVLGSRRIGSLGLGSRRLGLALLLISLILTVTARAATREADAGALRWDNSASSLVLAPQLELLEDPTSKLTLLDVQTGGYRQQFARPTGSPNFGFTTSAWWVRLRVHNDTDSDQPLTLRQDYPLIDYLDFWQQTTSGQWQQTATGDRRPFHQRAVEHRDFLFPIVVPAQSTSEFYLRFQSSGPVNINLTLHTKQDLLIAISKEQLALGLYYGGFLVLAIYNLFIFLAVKDRTFAYYLLYVVSYGLYMAVHNGLTFQFLWPNNPWLANQSLLVLLGLSLIWGLQFGRSILLLADIAPRTDRIAVWLQGLTVFATAIAPVQPYSLMILPMSVLTIAVTVMLMVMGGIGLTVGVRSARYFVLAWSALLIGVMVYMLKTFGVLPHNALTQNGFQIGSLIEMILLSLALGSRVSDLQRQTHTDPLTALGNRRLFNEQLDLALTLAVQHRRPLALLIVDIDHFKQFNDKHGHAAGDVAIRAVADVLAKHARKPFLACRYGGEEFVVLLPGASNEGAAVLAERLRKAVQQGTQTTQPITISVGLACLDDLDHRTAEKLFEAADFALYTAKERGRNQVVAYRDCHSRRIDHGDTAAAVSSIR